MSQPAINVTELDGALGILPASAGRLLAIVGPASSGPIDTPATFARIKDLVATFTSGPLVEAAAHSIDRYGRPVLVVRTGDSVDGTAGDVTSTASGTSVVTVGDATPDDDYEIAVKFVTGGTRGTAGATYQVSFDGGRTYGPTLALGTATSITVGGVELELAAGTFIAGDTHAVTTTAPSWNDSELGTALDALRATQAAWDIAEIVGATDADAFDALDLKFAGMHAAGKYHAWVANTRIPDADESEAEYLASLGTAFASKSSKFGSLYAGACKVTSSVSGRKYRRPVSMPVAALEASVDEHINIANVLVGQLRGVSIRDVNGNPDEHDESLYPGLDDARFGVLRTWGDDYPGVYVNRPRLFSPDGSDFHLMSHRRVLNVAHRAWRAFFIKRLSRPILVSRLTGFILESEAREIEAGARNAAADLLLAKPKASDVLFTLSRTDNVLSTKTLNGQGRVMPLAYPEFINLDVGYYNAALQVQAV